MEQIKKDYADRADKLQYAEQLLEKVKADFRDKNSRIKALEAHLDESRNEIGHLTRQHDYFKEEYESFQEELKHAYELRLEPSRTRHAPTSSLPSRTRSPVPDWHVSKRWRGWCWKIHQRPLNTLPHDKAKRICCNQPQIVERLGPKRPSTSLPRTLANSTPACHIAKMSKLIFKILISIWKCDLNVTDKDILYLTLSDIQSWSEQLPWPAAC